MDFKQHQSQKLIKERQLRQIKDHLENIIENVPSAIFIFDTEGKTLFVNKLGFESIEEVFDNRPPDTDNFVELLQLLPQYADYYDEDDRKLDYYQFPEYITLTTGKASRLILKRTVKKTGVAKWSDQRATPLFDSEGRMTMALIIITDITSVKENEIKIQQKEKHLELLSNTIPSLIAYIDTDMRYQTCNDAYIHWFRVSKEEIIGQKAEKFIGTKTWRIVKPLFRKAYEGEIVEFEKEVENRHGVKRWIHGIFTPTKNQKGEVLGIIIFLNDITKSKLQVIALSESEQRFRNIADETPAFLFLAGPDADVEFLNKTWINFTGLTTEEAKEHGWARVTHPDDLPMIFKVYSNAVKNKTPYSFEVRQKNNEGIYRWILWRGVPRFLQDGTFMGMMGFGIDIDQMKEIEQVKDDFLSITSHELKTPVTSLKAYTQLLQRKVVTAEQLADILEIMHNSINRLTALINDLLDVSRIQNGTIELRPEWFMLNKMIEDTVTEIKPTAGEHNLILNLSKDVKVFGDRNRISQVVINFLTNAIKYSPQTADVEISTSLSKEEITFCVLDHGMGIPERSIKKVFERFYRVIEKSRHTYPGLGLGLYVSAELIKRHNGKIWCKSKEGEGSSFCFSLPM